MAEVKCKVCGKIIGDIDKKEGYVQCPYCGEMFWGG